MTADLTNSDGYAQARYVRLVLRGEDGKRQTRYVRIVQDGELALGVRVTAYGETYERRVPGGVAHEQIVWTPADVIKRTDLRLSMRYGWLVKAPD